MLQTLAPNETAWRSKDCRPPFAPCHRPGDSRVFEHSRHFGFAQKIAGYWPVRGRIAT